MTSILLAGFLVGAIGAALASSVPARRALARAGLDARRAALLWALLFALAAGAIGILRHQGFESNALDMAMMDQLAWNTAHGRPLEGTFVGHSNQSYLGHHFTPALALIGVLYLIVPDPATLLVSQATALALTALLLFDLARRLTGHAGIALALMGALLLHPRLHSGLLFDFHQDSWAAALLALGVWGVVTRRWGIAAIGWLLGILMKEDIGVYWAALALYLAIRRPERRGRWLLFAGVNVAAVALIIGVLGPLFRPPDQPLVSLLYRYERFGNTPIEILTGMLTDPLGLLRFVLEPARREALALLLLPFAPVLLARSPALLVAIVPLGINLLSSLISQFTFDLHYAMIPLTWLGIVAALGIGHYLDRNPERRVVRAGQIAAFTWGVALTLLVLASPLAPQRLGTTVAPFVPDDHDRRTAALIATIPDNASVVAQGTLAPHLSQRRYATLYPRRLRDAPPEYFLLDLTANPWPFAPEEYAASIAALLDEPAFGPVHARDGLLLLERGASRDGVEAARRMLDEYTMAPTAVSE